MNNELKIEVDTKLSTGYITFAAKQIASTLSLSDSVNLDLDDAGNVVGLEMLRLDANLPEARLVEEFHLDANLVHKLNSGFFA